LYNLTIFYLIIFLKFNYDKWKLIIVKLFIFNFIIIIIITIIIILLYFINMKKVNAMFLLIYIKFLRLLFWFLFSFKNIKLVFRFFFVLLFQSNFVIFVKFLELDFLSKLKLWIKMIVWFVGVINIILVLIFYDKFFFYFKIFNKKYQSTSIL